MNILELALIFKNVPEFYIPVRIDNRGRVYCLVDYLNYQGIKLAKALLLFVVATTRHSRTNDLTSSKALSRAIK